MPIPRKQQEVDFHICRTRESTARILKSIVDNPTLTEAEQIRYLYQIAAEFAALAGMIADKFPPNQVFEVPVE